MRPITLITLSAIIILLNSSLKAQKTINTIKEKGQIVMGTSGAQRPFTFKDENDSLLGIDVEIARALANGMGVELVIREIAFENLLNELSAGNVDFIMSGMSMKLDRNMDFAMIGPYHNSDKVILSINGLKKFNVQDLNVESVKLVAVRNSTSEKLIKNYYPKAELILVENAELGKEKVQANEANAFVGDYETCAEIVFRSTDFKMTYIRDIPLYDPLGIAIRADDMLFLNLLNNFMDAVRASGYLKNLDKKYYE